MRKHKVRAIGWIAIVLSLSSCAFTDAAGRQHTVVFGLGVITTEPIGPASAQSIDATGVFVGETPTARGLVIGRARSRTLQVDPDADLVVELSDSPCMSFLRAHEIGSPLRRSAAHVSCNAFQDETNGGGGCSDDESQDSGR